MTRRGMPPRYCNGSATFSHALRCGKGVVLEHEADMPAAEARPVGVVPRGAVPPVIGERSVIVVVEQPDDGGETGFAGS